MASTSVIAGSIEVDQVDAVSSPVSTDMTSYWHLALWGILALIAFGVWHRLRLFVLPANRIPDGDVNTMGGALGCFVLAFVMLLLATLGRGFAAGAFDQTADLTLRTMWFLMLGGTLAQLPIAIYFFIKCSTSKEMVGPSVGKSFGLGVLGLILVLPVVFFALNVGYTLQMWMTGIEGDGIAHSGLELIVGDQDRAYLVPVLFLVIVAIPILEEILYRGLVQRGFRGLGFPPWFAIFAASLPFTMMHIGVVEPAALLGLFVLSLGFGWVYERGGSIMAPIVLHAGFNGVNAGYALLIPA